MTNELENQLTYWAQIDNKIKELNETIRNIREKKNTIEKNITNYIINNNLSNTTINIGKDKFRFSNTKIPEVLTFKYLEKTLKEIIKNDAQVQHIIDQIKLKRAIKLVPEIKRFSNN